MCNGEPLVLTGVKFTLLRVFVQSARRVLSRDNLAAITKWYFAPFPPCQPDIL